MVWYGMVWYGMVCVILCALFSCIAQLTALQTLLKADFVAYKIVPIMNMDDYETVRQDLATERGKVRSHVVVWMGVVSFTRCIGTRSHWTL